MDLSGPWSVKFAEKNPLPCAEIQPARINKYRNRTSSQRSHYMGWRVSFQVFVWVIHWNNFLKCGKDVILYVWVCALIDREARSGVGIVNNTHTAVAIRSVYFFLKL